MDKLLPVKNDIKSTLWCGPAALSATTGVPVSKIIEVAKQLSGREQISGMSNWLMERVADALGYRLYTIHTYYKEYIHQSRKIGQYTVYGYYTSDSKPTLAQYARKHQKEFAEHAVIVNVTGHYVALYGRRFCDSHTKVPVFLSKSPRRRSRVSRVWQVHQKPTTSIKGL
jgi:hypothetical protein